MAVLMVAVQFRGARSLVNGISCTMVFGALSLLIMVGPVRRLFAPLIEGILGKTLTFTGRTYIWDSVLDLMTGKHVLIGYGSSIRFDIVVEGIPYSDPHSFLLYLWLTGGVAGFVLSVALMGVAVHALYRYRRVYSVAVLAAVVACFFVIGLMESLITIAWPLFVALAFYWGTVLGTRRSKGVVDRVSNTRILSR